MFDSAVGFLGAGLVLGLSAGLSPGPMLTLVITETLKRSPAAGARVALAPLATDPPIILASLFLVHSVSGFEMVLGLLSFLGGAYILYLAWECMAAEPLSGVDSDVSHSFRKGVLTNFLNPQPYIFWISVGGPTMIAASEINAAAPWCYVLAFYASLVGAKMGVALAAGRFRSLIRGKGYVWLMRCLGLALALFAMLLWKQGFALIDFI